MLLQTSRLFDFSGRETGLGTMTVFDKKISAGNASLLRSRDIYHLMERLDFVTGFLFFHG